VITTPVYVIYKASATAMLFDLRVGNLSKQTF